MSKGSWYRKVNKKKFDEGYDRIFGGSKDVDGKQDEDNNTGEIMEETEVQPFKSTDPVLRSIEADNR